MLYDHMETLIYKLQVFHSIFFNYLIKIFYSNDFFFLFSPPLFCFTKLIVTTLCHFSLNESQDALCWDFFSPSPLWIRERSDQQLWGPINISMGLGHNEDLWTDVANQKSFVISGHLIHWHMRRCLSKLSLASLIVFTSLRKAAL